MAMGAQSFAGYTVLDASKAVAVPSDISFEDATCGMMQGLTAQYLVTDVYTIKKGDNVLIQAAAGGMGQLLTQVAAARGANVVATVSSAEKAKIAKANGAHTVIRYSDDAGNPVEWASQAVAASTGGKGFEVVYDSVGKATFSGSFEVLKKRGYLVLFGAASGAPDAILPTSLGPKSLFVTRPMLFHYVEREGELQARARDVFSWIKEGTIKFNYTKLPLSETANAHKALETRATTGKILVEIPHP
jgi:NADPH2:quinone reductase